MKILTRYIFREALLFFGISLFAFTSILLTIRMLRFASLIVNKGVEASQIAQVFISIIPTFLEIAIPMSVLLGVMMAFARLSGDSEIIVMRASGISIFQLVKPILLVGLATGLISLVVSQCLKPWGFRNLSRALFEIARTKTTSGLTEGVFNPLGDLTLYSEKIDYDTGNLEHVLIDDRRDKLNRRIIVAKTGKILSDVDAQTISLLLNDGSIHERQDTHYVLTHFINNNLEMNSEELLDSSSQKKDKSPREMGLAEIRAKSAEVQAILADPDAFTKKPVTNLAAELAKPTNNLGFNTRDEAKKRFSRLRTELGSRFSMPFASFVLALVALPLGILSPRTQRTWGAGLSLSVGLAVFVFYYGLLTVGVTLGENGSINSTIGLWIPNVVALGAGLYFLNKIGSEQWSSIGDVFANSLTASSFKQRFRSLGKIVCSTSLAIRDIAKSLRLK